MKGGPSIIRHHTSEKSNTELINSLRANFQATQQVPTPPDNRIETKETGDTISNVNGASNHYTTWTSREGNLLYVPSIDFELSGLCEERSQYDITVKLFFLPTTKTAARCSLTEEAAGLVLKELHVTSIDLLIVSFPGISFDADDDEDEEFEGNQNQEAEHLEEMTATWRTLEDLHYKGVVAQIGLAEFGSERLRKFLPTTKIRPSVDQINVRDCCVVPKSLILYAKQEKIELLTHNDCTNILPKGTIRDLLGSGGKGAGLLADHASQGLTGDVEPQWVVKYTAVVRDRGVIENKGYFAMAEIDE